MAIDKGQLKEILKPLLKECVKEVLFEEGVLSRVIAECVKAMKPVLSESPSTNQAQPMPQKGSGINKYFEMLKEEKESSGLPQTPKMLKNPVLSKYFANSTPMEGDPLEGIQSQMTRMPSMPEPTRQALPAAVKTSSAISASPHSRPVPAMAVELPPLEISSAQQEQQVAQQMQQLQMKYQRQVEQAPSSPPLEDTTNYDFNRLNLGIPGVEPGLPTPRIDVDDFVNTLKQRGN